MHYFIFQNSIGHFSDRAHQYTPTNFVDLKFLIPTLISIGALVVSYLAYRKGQDKLFVKESIDAKGFQAVFLTNGQVYFGKITQVDKALVKLEQIFYLQAGTDLQEAKEQNLVKLGEELHGPRDIMFIDRSHVIFWENLKESSGVVKAIRDFKKD